MKTILIDDERLARTELCRLLEPFEQIQIIGQAINGFDGLEKIIALAPDLIFLDIQMPGKTGFEMLSELSAQGIAVPKVIFTTAYDAYALKAFEFNAADYLLKPIDPARLADAISRLNLVITEDNLDQDDERLVQITQNPTEPIRMLSLQDQVFVKDGERCWFVRLGQIRIFESEGNYVRTYFDKHKPLILRSLNALEERLDPQFFFRASRKHIINLEAIESIEPYFGSGLLVKMISGEKIEISRRQAIKFKELKSL